MLDHDQTLIDELHNNICSTAQDIIHYHLERRSLHQNIWGLAQPFKKQPDH